MANIYDAPAFIAYVKQWEGGLSKDKRDAASAYPVPDGSGYHTNKGVTWQTFVSSAAKAGYPATPEVFYEMSDETWTKIFKVTFWDIVQADKIVSQSVAELIVDWTWGSGPGVSVPHVQRYLISKGYEFPRVTTNFGPITLTSLNNEIMKTGEKKVFEDLYKIRYNFLDVLGTKAYPMFRQGWLNRMKAFYAMIVKRFKW